MIGSNYYSRTCSEGLIPYSAFSEVIIKKKLIPLSVIFVNHNNIDNKNNIIATLLSQNLNVCT